MLEDVRERSEDLSAVEAISAIPPILKIICASTGMRFAAVARVTQDSWTALATRDELGIGLGPGGQLEVATTLCAESRRERRALVVERASSDPALARFCATPYGFESQVTVPIVLSDGSYFGNLCAMDVEARATSARTVGMFADYAALAGRLIDLELERRRTEKLLGKAEDVGRSREEFIAVVAHDLRNPLASFQAAADLMLRSGEARFVRVGQRLKSSAERMRAMIDDLLDFSRGRSGTGLSARLAPRDDLNAALSQVVDEIRDAHPGREIRSDLAIDGVVDCDASRLQQLLSNLLGNAVAYGDKAAPIVVECFGDGPNARLVVANWGQAIPADEISKMFDPFWRAAGREVGGSLGLGLHICRQIAEAHGGSLRVSSSAEEGTRFEMRWPRRTQLALMAR